MTETTPTTEAAPAMPVAEPLPPTVGSLIGSVADLKAQWEAQGLMAPPGTGKPFNMDDYLREQRLERFKALCPDEFRQKIDRTKLPNLKAWDEADSWAGAHPGIWLWSHESGRGKTRMGWRLFGRLHCDRGMHIIKASGQRLAESYFETYMDGEPRSFYRWLMKGDVLFIDDIDKMDTADRRYVRMLRELFDELYAAQKPVVVTANEPIEYFATIAGDSCVRRMREVCREIAF